MALACVCTHIFAAPGLNMLPPAALARFLACVVVPDPPAPPPAVRALSGSRTASSRSSLPLSSPLLRSKHNHEKYLEEEVA